MQPVTTRPNFIELEQQTLRWWRERDMIARYIRKNDGAPRRWSFIDGPITANNPMGVHHAWGRSYKDLYQRFHTMLGEEQRYQNGFDCQGLWIEVEVEKQHGFTSKKDILDFGIDKFVQECKDRVTHFAGMQTEQSIRLGYWMDWDHSYYTNSDENNYTIWGFLKTCWERGWVYKGHDVMPWCPRCATGLSEHEIVTEGYKEITHTSVYLTFPLAERPGESLLVWTTTPWTLAGNIAAAVHPELRYLKVRQAGEVLYVSKGAAKTALRGEHEVLGEVKGVELVGLHYHGPFDELAVQQDVEHRVIAWSEVSDEEGTGIVHIAPGSGKEDFALSKEFGLSVIAPTDDEGIYLDGFGWLTGRSVSDDATRDAIFASLREKQVLYRTQAYPHRYPVCWRCGTELIFRLVDEWFISMGELRHKIADVTRQIRWIPDFGLARELDWLKNMDDWMISKKRYYGLALPIFDCTACGTFEVIGSETELHERAVEGWEVFEGHSPHKPFIDAVKINCKSCGEVVSRIPDVGNPWLDAGIVPFSTLSYRNDRAYWERWFPAQFITEAFPGQFRNWFYSLLTMATALEDRPPFETVLGHAMVRDEHGEEMHKSSGNAIWFDDAAETMGVDVMRWLFVRQNPANNVNFGTGPADEVRRGMFLTLWNTYAFFVTYAQLDGWKPQMTQMATDAISGSARLRRARTSDTPERGAGFQPARTNDAPERGAGFSARVPADARTELDRWALSELHALVRDVTDRLQDFDAAAATRLIEGYIEDLSNWYVRRSRRRFWKSESDADKRAAYATLYECLTTLTLLLAPFTPFTAEAMYQNLVRSFDDAAPESVHLAGWPRSDGLAHRAPSASGSVDVSNIERSETYQIQSGMLTVQDAVDRFGAPGQASVRLSGKKVDGRFHEVGLRDTDVILLLSPSVADKGIHGASGQEPATDGVDDDLRLRRDMRLVMRVASLGRAARAKAQLKVRQPVAELLVKLPSAAEERALERLAPQLLDELNVKALRIVRDEGDFLRFEVKPNLKLLGQKYGKAVQDIARALGAMPDDERARLARAVAAGESVEVADKELAADELLVNGREREGFASAEETGTVVIVSSELTPELVAEGLAREIVHRIQNLRKDAGFEIADRIKTYYRSDSDGGELAGVMQRFGDYVRQETLSVELSADAPPAACHAETAQIDGREITLAVVRV